MITNKVGGAINRALVSHYVHMTKDDSLYDPSRIICNGLTIIRLFANTTLELEDEGSINRHTTCVLGIVQ